MCFNDFLWQHHFRKRKGEHLSGDERDDDIVMLAEHHMNKEGTIKLNKFFGAHTLMATASPARPTERSAKGTTAGVLVAAKNYLDNMTVSIALDAEGKLTCNEQLTGRMIV